MIAAKPWFLWWACLVPAWCLAIPSPPTVIAQEKSVLDPDFNMQYVEAVNVTGRAKGVESEYNEIYRYRDGVVACLSLEKGMDVADVGAGTGFFSRLFATKVGPSGKVYATDIARSFVEYIDETARTANLPNLKALVNTERSTTLPPESVDIVFTSETYHHFAYPKDMLASIHQALRPGGALVIIDEIRNVPGENGPDTHVRCGKGTVMDEVAEAGFDFVSEIPMFTEHYFLIFRKRPKRRYRQRELYWLKETQPAWDMYDSLPPPLFGVILRKAPALDYAVPHPPGVNSSWKQGKEFKQLLELAYGVSSLRIKISESLTAPDGKFELFASLPKDHQGLRMSLMKQAVETTFNLQSHVESKLTDVYVLTAPDGPGKKLQPVAPDADLSKMEISDDLVPTRADLADEQGDHSDKRRGFATRLFLTATITDIARIIDDRSILDKPILDESGLSGRFNGYLAFYVADSKEYTPDPKSLISYARRHLGLVLTPAKREVEFTIVEPRPSPPSMGAPPLPEVGDG